MADVKISELPVATAIASPDVTPVVQGGVTKRADVSLFGISGSIADKQVAFGSGTAISGNSSGLTWDDENETFKIGNPDSSGSSLNTSGEASFAGGNFLIDSNGRINIRGIEIISSDGTVASFVDSDTIGISVDTDNGNFSIENNVGVSIDLIVGTANGYISIGPPLLLNPQATPPSAPTEGWMWEDGTEHAMYWFDGTDTREFVDMVDDVITLSLRSDPPGSPVEGMIYADTDHHLYYYNGTTWKQLDN